jgi:hypothetical protein
VWLAPYCELMLGRVAFVLRVACGGTRIDAGSVDARARAFAHVATFDLANVLERLCSWSCGLVSARLSGMGGLLGHRPA